VALDERARRFPMARFQPGIAAMYACAGASPSAFAMRGLPPEEDGDLSAFSHRDRPGLRACLRRGLGLVADLCRLLARDVTMGERGATGTRGKAF
jgi:hypothetical protein